MTLDVPAKIVKDCFHSGDCFSDCESCLKNLENDEGMQFLYAASDKLLTDICEEYGLECANEYDTEDLRIRVLWLACGDLTEEYGEEYFANY